MFALCSFSSVCDRILFTSVQYFIIKHMFWLLQVLMQRVLVKSFNFIALYCKTMQQHPLMTFYVYLNVQRFCYTVYVQDPALIFLCSAITDEWPGASSGGWHATLELLTLPLVVCSESDINHREEKLCFLPVPPVPWRRLACTLCLSLDTLLITAI